MPSSNYTPSIDYSIKAIETEYKGRLYRSRLEAKWAAFFDLCGWNYEYEPVDFDGWFPDFALYGEGWGETTGGVIFLEVKPITEFHQETADRIAQACPDAPVALIGLKPDANIIGYVLYPYETWRSVLMEYDSKGAALSGKHGEFWDVSMSKVNGVTSEKWAEIYHARITPQMEQYEGSAQHEEDAQAYFSEYKDALVQESRKWHPLYCPSQHKGYNGERGLSFSEYPFGVSFITFAQGENYCGGGNPGCTDCCDISHLWNQACNEVRYIARGGRP